MGHTLPDPFKSPSDLHSVDYLSWTEIPANFTTATQFDKDIKGINNCHLKNGGGKTKEEICQQ
jgi:hypothetical protein